MSSPSSTGANRSGISRARAVILSAVWISVAGCGGGGGKGGGNSPPPPPTDTTPPETTITSGPPAQSNSSSASFSFTSSEANSRFESSLDNAAYIAATSPLQLTNLANGQHTFRVRAIDAAGNVDATPASTTWAITTTPPNTNPPDTTPPETEITSSPAVLTNQASASFTATASESGATFEVSLDGAAFAAQSFPLQLSNLGEGQHTLLVRARDTAGNVDASPASRQWVIDLTAPDTALSIAPQALTNSTSATFVLTASEQDVTFDAAVDGGAYQPVASSLPLTGLTEGVHTISTRATDRAGNTDASPVTFTWRIDVTPPTAAIVFPTPVSYTDAVSLTVRGSAFDANGVTSVTINGVAAQSTTSFTSWTAQVPIGSGQNTLAVTVTDAAGNVGANADTATVTNRGPVIVAMRAMDYDPLTDRILVIDQHSNRIYAYRASDGIGVVLSDGRPPFTRPDVSIIEDLVVDSANNRAIVVDNGIDQLESVNLTTGARDSLSLPSVVPDGMSLAQGTGVALDVTNQRAFVTTRGADAAVIAIDLATGSIGGNRSIVSSATVGTGVALNNPLGIAYDDVTNPGAPRLLVAMAPLPPAVPAIISVDVATGNRTVFSSANPTGTGTALEAPVDVKLDATNNRILVLDASATRNALVAIELATGNRTILADSSTGTGTSLQSVAGLALHPTARAYIGQRPGGQIVQVELGSLNRMTLVDSSVGSGARLRDPRGVTIASAAAPASELLYTQAGNAAVMRVDLATGARTEVSGSTAGSGLTLSAPTDLTLDRRASTAGSHALVLDTNPGNAVFSIDLVSGARTRLSDLNTSGGAAVGLVRGMRLDIPRNRVLVTDPIVGAVYAVDLATGTRSTLSDSSHGSGSDFIIPVGLALEPASNPTRVLIGGSQAIVAVDLLSGNRSTFVHGTAGQGAPFSNMGPLTLDSIGQRVIGATSKNLIAVSLASTVRTLLSGTDTVDFTLLGNGPRQTFPNGMDVDTASGIAFIASGEALSIMAIDLVTGDRVLVAH